MSLGGQEQTPNSHRYGILVHCESTHQQSPPTPSLSAHRLPPVMSPVRQVGLGAGIKPKMTAATNPEMNAVASFTFM
jgi:hypothetical protein